MSIWDIKGLETNFDGFRKDRFPNLSVSDAFERSVARQILKDADLSDDETESGMLGGSDDGGVDGMFFFVNRILIQDETDLPEEALSAQLFVIQAKNETGFSEQTIVKLEAFARDLLDHSRDVDEMVHLNVTVRDAITRFRENYTKILASPHTMTVVFIYGSKSDQDPNPKVLTRVEALKKYIREQLSDALVDFEFWGCQRLLASARRSPKTTETLDITKQFTADDGSAVCLVKLGSLASLLRDEEGRIRRSMLEPNVRDYQGVKNKVNEGIRHTLETAESPEFWWLNNGVTIVATKCSVVGNKLVVERPEVVNGLQTSYEIFQYFRDNPNRVDARNVLIRVIVPPDEQVRSKIIRATNFQTPISEISLHATDPIHFDIEEKFRLYQLYYERRKGEYRELRKRVDQIISIQTLARAVMAILLQQPNNAYATPTRALKNEETYTGIFNETYNRDVYVTCMLLQRQVDIFVAGREDLLRDTRSIIRYYVSMCIACALCKSSNPGVMQLSSLLPIVLKPIEPSTLDECAAMVLATYSKLGANDKVAKGPEMRDNLKSALAAQYSNFTLTS
jgi:hypothetical protein